MIFRKTSYTQSNYAFPLPYFKAKACLARNRQCSRQYAYLRIDVTSAQIFAQNRNFASRKQNAQTRQYVIRDTQCNQAAFRSAGFLCCSAPLNDKRMNDKTKLKNKQKINLGIKFLERALFR